MVGYGETGRVRLTTLTKEFFMPRFLERDECEREAPLRAISLGRRAQRAPVPEIPDQRGRRRVLVWQGIALPHGQHPSGAGQCPA